jgi:hypothetical protein
MNKKDIFVKLIIDVALLTIIIITGWFLIGYYLQGEYLATNYQDWIYHAWRVKTLNEYGGMPSWDHIWSNGINHWRSYQYTQHWLIWIVSHIFKISITKAMLLVTVSFFIMLRVGMYIILRIIKIRPIIAFLATILSFVYVQQWIAISDFSIFISFLIIPFYLYLWINVLHKYQLKYGANMRKRVIAELTLALISGSLWMLHPVLANAVGGLFFMSIGFRAIKINLKYFVGVLFSYIVGALPFFLPYFLASAHFSNPIFSASIFLRDTIAGNFFGLSMYFVAFIGAIWLMVIFMSKKVPLWSKTIIIYSTLYLFLIFLAQNNYVPAFIVQLQISRVVPILALFIAFAFGGALNGVMSEMKILSRGTIAIILIISVMGITESIKIATAFTGQPVHNLDDPVSLYFNNLQTPRGSIYVKNVAAASFFGKRGLRFINSYNEHLLPHPLSIRFSSFMRSEIAYTGIPKAQVQLINDFTGVLGVEYLVLPETSPLVNELTKGTEQFPATFELVNRVITQEGAFSILHNTREINYTYLAERGSSFLAWKKSIGKPTLQVSSYKQWDESIHNLAEKIKEGTIIKFTKLNFIDTNKLFIPVNDISDLKNKNILITQSYDKNWKINHKHKYIKPSQDRFIVIDTTNMSNQDLTVVNGVRGILLSNKWPIWHWPLQFFGLFLLLLFFVLLANRSRIFFVDKL